MILRSHMLFRSICALGFAVSLAQGPAAHAAPTLPTGLTASATMTFDDGFAASSLGGTGSQSGGMRLSGQPDANYAGFMVTGANPQFGGLSEVGHGFGFGGSASASDNGTFGVFMDYGLSLINGSATDAFRITLGLRFDNQVTSSGDDAFAHSEFVLKNGGSELFFTDLWSDALFGNVVDGNPTPDFGGPLGDAGSRTFAFDLAAGESLNLDGFWDLRGGASAQGALASSFFDVFFTIEDVQLLGVPPNPVPAPGSLPLLCLGLASLAAMMSRRRAIPGRVSRSA